MGHDSIGTGHILLGLIRDDEGVGAEVLVKLEVDLIWLRRHVIQLLSDSGHAEGMTATVVEENLTYHEELRLPNELDDVQAAIFDGDTLDEIRALLRDVVERLECIERQLGENN